MEKTMSNPDGDWRRAVEAWGIGMPPCSDFSRALDAPTGDAWECGWRVAQVFMRQGHYDDVLPQLALGFAEARISSGPASPEDILEAANIFLAVHDFDLAEMYFDKASWLEPIHMAEIGRQYVWLPRGRRTRLRKPGQSRSGKRFLPTITIYMNCGGEPIPAAAGYGACAFPRSWQANTVAVRTIRPRRQTAQNKIAGREGHQITQM